MELEDKIKKQWKETVLGYGPIVKEELDSFKVDEWIKLIDEQIDGKKKLKVLDIGSYPEIFSTILSKCGHDVTSVEAKSIIIDSYKMNFKDNTFDLILSRNIIWDLYEPIKAYEEWKRVLKNEGRLLIFDANWDIEKIDEGLKLQFDKKVRPEWDEMILSKMGFKNLIIKKDITHTVWDDKERLLFGNTPMFMISCKKSKDDMPKSFEDLNKDLKDYWDVCSSSYSDDNNKELQSKQKDIWTDVILENVEKNGKLKVLDIGCGPGEFSILMAKVGHDVIGIDMTEGMLKEAKNNALKYNVEVDFRKMNGQNLDFEDDTFDLIISRNVTWLLQDVESFFKGCSRVLKENGRLVYFDANWYLYLHDESAREKKKIADNKFREIYKKEAYTNSPDLSLANMAYDLPMSRCNRPNWDRENLHNYNLEVVKIDDNISKRVLTKKDQLRFSSTPMFTVVAMKTKTTH